MWNHLRQQPKYKVHLLLLSDVIACGRRSVPCYTVFLTHVTCQKCRQA